METEMDMYTAVAIAEGMQDADDEETLDAYQYLVDTGIIWEAARQLWSKWRNI
jgi:hypothetical protein